MSLYDSARHALEKAVAVDEVKEIRDKAEALRAYAKQQKDTELERRCAELKIRASRRIGELSRVIEKATAGRPGKILPTGGKNLQKPKNEVLSEAGISTAVAHRCEKLAEVPLDVFDAYIDGMKDTGKPTTMKKILASTVRSMRKADSDKRVEAIKSQEASSLDGMEFDCIVVDPPWQMEKIGRDERPNQAGFDYPTMDEKGLGRLKLPCAEHCHVFVWTTHKHLPMAFRLLEAWDLKYVCAFVWHKPGGFQPFGLPQYNCEFVLYARKGTPEFIDTKAFPTCFTAPRGRHSEKPEEFYDMLRRVTEGARLDMFSRRNIDGFTGWGNEARI